MGKTRIYDMRMHTRALGPGVRTAIWFQGCEKRCRGCMSPKSRNLKGGIEVETEKIINAVLETKDIEGITISGGEPFLQADALYDLISAVKQKTDLGVIIYTGYTISELRKKDDSKIEKILCGLADLIIDGEYMEDLNDGKSLRGSSNQNIVFITDRYKKDANLYGSDDRNTEVFIEGEKAFFVGIPDKETLARWKKMGSK